MEIEQKKCLKCNRSLYTIYNNLDICQACLDIETHNQWIDELTADIEFEPLKDFLNKLKE